ncbi:PRP28 [Candida margitis]|uniref:PRP28 n=1 Tax=Candida margitis TaxID=1775924 RepID=UPI00222675D0|nr:PRP28 [Candida margitis]KAI5969977.1 PRP28 [Candida margitis]
MSKRPIPIDKLLKDDFAKPTFIPKSKRAKAAESRELEKRQAKEKASSTSSSWRHTSKPRRGELVPPIQHNDPTPIKKSARRKFQFDWDESEDTTTMMQTSRRMLPSLDDDEENGTTTDEVDANDPLLKDELSGHWTTKQLPQMTERDWRIFNEEFSINYRGGGGNGGNKRDLPHAIRYWQECDLSKPIQQSIQDLGYTTPTPIQRASIPTSLKYRDVVGVAETGSGKTLAYLLPIFQYLDQIDANFMQFEKAKNEPLALILAPTRELALQITAQAEKLCTRLGYSVVSIIGGHQYRDTIDEIENGGDKENGTRGGGRGVDIIVGTPGRLLDSLDRNIINFQKCYYLVMDEADRMIDLGFERDLHKLIAHLPTQDNLQQTIDGKIFHLNQRMNLMFTATISPTIEKLTKSYLNNPIYVTIGTSTGGSGGEALANIDQKFEYLQTSKTASGPPTVESIKLNKLVKLIQSHKRTNPDSLIIIFANFKYVVETLSEELDAKQLSNVTIHGSKSQGQRELALEQFKSHNPSILVATDVAARGIDIPQVGLVVNYQMSHKFDEYVHRIGRTGRAGNFGTSITFINDDDVSVFSDLKKFLTRGGKKVPDWLYRYNSTTIRE